MPKSNKFDVIIIGGSYAGLSAAMALGRSLRNTLVIDAGQPCNRQTPQSHNFLTHDGNSPWEISTLAKSQVAQYKTVQFLEDTAIRGSKTDNGIKISTQSKGEFEAKKLIFATGVKDIMPVIPGFSDCWGISMVHCPYCHGYEYRGKKTGIMANGEKAMHLASLVNNLTKNLTILTQGKADFTSEQELKLKQHCIEIIESPVVEIAHEKGYINNITLQNGEIHDFDAVYASIPFAQHTEIPKSLGCSTTEDGHIEIDHFFKTTVNGVYACGDNATPFRSVANAVFSGNATGALVNKELVDDVF